MKVPKDSILAPSSEESAPPSENSWRHLRVEESYNLKVLKCRRFMSAFLALYVLYLQHLLLKTLAYQIFRFYKIIVIWVRSTKFDKNL